MKPKILKRVFAVFSVLLFIGPDTYSQWFQLTTNTSETLNDIFFVNPNTGVAAGSNGKIIRTTDAGQNWVSVLSNTTNSLYSLDFPDVLTGYTGGYTGTVLRTLNGGASWSHRTGCGINIRCVSFISVNTGITAGGGTLMCYTTDGGYSWNPRVVPVLVVTGVTFINDNTLLTCATDLPGAAIYKSVDTGMNWSAVLTLNNSGLDIMYSLSCIYFKNPMTGFCTGSRISYGQQWGTIYRTSNGGQNWEVCGSVGPAPGSALFGIHFGEPNTGFAVGNNGVIMCSTNGGSNWTVQSGVTTENLNGVHMLNSLTGYACGYNGIVLKTTNGGVTGFINVRGEIPEKFFLYQNYPNPFNPVTAINYDLPVADYVKLFIYDALGREISTIVKQKQNAGKYKVEWDATDYPSGVYFYKLITGNYNETKKMVLIK